MEAYHNASLPLQERVRDLLSRLTIQEKAALLSSRQMPIPRLGMKMTFLGTEIARGVVSRWPDRPTTVTPQPIGLSATFDPDLMLRLGRMAGLEARVMAQRAASEKGRRKAEFAGDSESDLPPLSENSGLLLFGPTVDMERDPRWGRNEEAYGEDPYLTGQMTAAYTRGLRGDHPDFALTIPGLKHFALNNNEEGRVASDSQVSQRLKHEYYYAAFEPAITEGGALGVMTSYNEINGVPALCNPDVGAVLKKDWGMAFAMSDGGDFEHNVTEHKAYPNHAESVAAALRAGVDFMLDSPDMVAPAVLEALERGLITEKELDAATENILRLRFLLGDFDLEGKNPYKAIDPALLCCDAHAKLNLQAACEQMTLLKNDGTLPLDPAACGRVLLWGPLGDQNYMDWYTGYSAYNVSFLAGMRQALGQERVLYDDGFDDIALLCRQNGKYLSCLDDGTLRFCADAPGERETFALCDWGFGQVVLQSRYNGKYVENPRIPPHSPAVQPYTATSDTTFDWFIHEKLFVHPTPDGLTLKAWNGQPLEMDADGMLVAGLPGSVTENRLFKLETLQKGTERAAKLCEQVDTILLAMGNDPMMVARECDDRPDITLPASQSAMIRAAQQTGKPCALVIISSYPYAVVWEQDNLPAILWSSHAGPELGNALADTLLGRANPAGRLSQTWYRSIQDLPSIFNYDILTSQTTYQYFRGRALYPFGHGLSYARFAYDNLTLDKGKQGVTVSFTLRNTSERDGDEVVQVYLHAVFPYVQRPIKTLAAFARVPVSAGKAVTLALDVPYQRFAFYDVRTKRFMVEAGAYEMMVGASSGDIRLSDTLDIPGETIAPRNPAEKMEAINFDGGYSLKTAYDKKTCRWYTLFGEGAYATLRDVQTDGITTVTMIAGTQSVSGKIALCVDDRSAQPVCTLSLPSTGASNRFVVLTAACALPAGVHTLYIHASRGCGLMEVQFS